MNIKKIGMIMLILVLVAIYANIGYWIGQVFNDAQGQMNPSILHSFFLGPDRFLAKQCLPRAITIIAWPILVIFISFVWLVEGFIWLGYFMFGGGLFKAIGLIPSIILILASILCVRRVWHVNHKKTG